MAVASFIPTTAGCTTFPFSPRVRVAPRLSIPLTQRSFGSGDGDKARILRDGRSIEVEVELSDEMMPGVISLPHGWGHDLSDTRMSVAAKNPGANLNAIVDENLRDPLSGNAVLSGIAVQMEAVSAPLVVAAGPIRFDSQSSCLYKFSLQ